MGCFYRGTIIFLLVIVVVLSLLSGYLSPDGFTREWWAAWLQNFSTEVLGALLTFVFFELFLGTQQSKEQAEQQMKSLKQNTIGNLKTSSSERAKAASDDLRRYGWLVDGSLRGVELHEAVIEDVNLYGADMQGAVMTMIKAGRVNFFDCKLQNANLTWAQLPNANLSFAKLNQAILREANLFQVNAQTADFTEAILLNANLHQADLSKSNLTRADLSGADLRDARFTGANLEGAKVTGTRFDESTILPDGNRWKSASDLTRFGCVV